MEADACAKELTQILKQRMVTQKDEAAECIQMVRKLGEPIESLQANALVSMPILPVCLLCWLMSWFPDLSVVLCVCLLACLLGCQSAR